MSPNRRPMSNGCDGDYELRRDDLGEREWEGQTVVVGWEEGLRGGPLKQRYRKGGGERGTVLKGMEKTCGRQAHGGRCCRGVESWKKEG